MCKMKKYIFFNIVLLIIGTVATSDSSDANLIEEMANHLFKKFWEWRMLNKPELATTMGVSRYNDRLNEMGLSSYKRRADELRMFLTEIESISKEASKSVKDETVLLNIKLFKNDLQQCLNGMQFKPYLWPLNNMEGPQIHFPRLIHNMRAVTINDVISIIQRMRLFSQQIEETITLLNEGIRLGLTMNKISFQTAGLVFGGLSKEAFNKSLFFRPFTRKPENVSILEWEKIVNRAQHIAEHYIFPSYKRLADFLLGKYLLHSREKIGVSSLPNGKEYYNSCLRFHTTTDLTAAEIHQIGLKEVKRITRRMEKIRKQVGFKGDLQKFRNYLRNNATFGFENEAEILKGYREIQLKVNSTLEKYFQRLPKLPYVIKPVPKEVAPSYPIGYYENVSPNGKIPGVFYANTFNPNTRRKYVTMALFLHEAVPGHHLQTSLTYQYGSAVSFRRFVGVDVNFYEVPAHFATDSAYIEGWGLYAEYLGEEMGLYSDPYNLFGRLSSEMLRACRLVIDTGIHMYGWSRSRSVKYLQDNTAEDKLDIRSEVDRYITWPGQACAYKIGEMKILELRRKCEKSLGKLFNIGRFHDFIVTMGGVPLNILEEQINVFITKEQANNNP